MLTLSVFGASFSEEASSAAAFAAVSTNNKTGIDRVKTRHAKTAEHNQVKREQIGIFLSDAQFTQAN
jgi:hypothetical protein